jgi:uncharacterized membrane protein
MANARIGTAVFALCTLSAALAAAPARADLKICNRMSYVADAAIAVEEKGVAASRGWFRIDPGSCRAVLQGALTADQLYVHVRVSPVYGPSPLPQQGHAEFCVGRDNFVSGGARNCRAGQRPAPFTAVKPSGTPEDATVNLAEEAEYSDVQARDAGIQRLLVAAGYDAAPIDGIRGAKTDAVLMQFLQDNKLAPTAAAKSDFFDVLLEAAQKPGTAFTWCNDTVNTVMAAIGYDDRGMVVTRGWYRVEPGKCLKPDVGASAKRFYSFGEAIDADGRAMSSAGKPIAWGGREVFCTRPTKFEIFDQGDCAAKGLTSAGFTPVDLSAGKTVRFR